MKTIKQLFNQGYKLRVETENLILATIVSMCDKKGIEWNGYWSQFENSDGDAILTKNHIHKKIKEFEDTFSGVFDPQFFYKPKEYAERTYKEFHLDHLDLLHKIIKKHNLSK